MFCPKCGLPLSDDGRVFTCVMGEMQLSESVSNVLRERYRSDGTVQSDDPPFDRRLHGGLGWFCPGCGSLLDESMECPSCHCHLRDLVYRLIELHPHNEITT
jgi:hypothetical protein